MPTFIQHTTNPTTVEVGVEFFLPTDAKHWIPNGFDMVEFVVDSTELEEDRNATLEQVAEAWCTSLGIDFARVIESDEW